MGNVLASLNLGCNVQYVSKDADVSEMCEDADVSEMCEDADFHLSTTCQNGARVSQTIQKAAKSILM